MDIISYILSRKYTDNSLIGLGALKGANCTVKDIVHQDGINTVTFEWEGTDGTKKTRDMVVYDGTPIYVWESGNTYHYGDLAIYESQFYRCIIENSDVTFDNTKWNEIGSPDGNYDIVQSKDLLPARFTAADRKLYFIIDECIFYLWDGTQWVAQTHLVQESTMPTASAKYLGRIYQYIGTTNANFTHGYIYECVSNGATPAVYSWEEVLVQKEATLLNIMNKYNVLDYGLVGDGITDNTVALRNMLDVLPWGAIVYFPKGVYNISNGFTINKSVCFEGETITQQRFLSASSQPHTRWQDSAINYIGNTPNTTLFNITGSVHCSFKGVTFYGHAYSVSENTDEFTSLPYPFFKETTLIENVSCLARDGGMWSIENCMFLGFSGYAVQIHHNIYVKNCGFYECKIGILEEGTDSNIQNCYFTKGGTAIKTTPSVLNGQNIGYTNLNISDCWCDQMAHHFIESTNTSNVMYNTDNVWIDMIDESAISIPNAFLKQSIIQGRYSRCGMKYAGLTDAQADPSLYNDAIVIYAKRIVSSDIHISCDKRPIGQGNNRNGVCPYKLAYVIDEGNLTFTNIYTDMPYSDVVVNETYRAEIHTLNYEDVERFSLWDYHTAKIAFRNNSPIGRARAVDVNRFCYDTSTKTLYRSTAANDNTAWEVVSTTPTFIGTQAQWDVLTTAQQNQYDIVNITGDQQDLNLGQYLRKVQVMPNAEDAPSETVLYVGATTSNYTQGFTYRSVPVVESGVTTYHWESVFGTAAQKNFTDNVRPNSHDLVESNAVYNAISSSIASIYKPHGDLTCAQLTSDLLIPTNIGNVYNMTDSGTTSALFIQGAGKTIHVNDTVGIIQADNSAIMFNLMGSMLDLHDYQTKELETPLTIGGATVDTVEGALGALNNDKQTMFDIMQVYNVLDYGLVGDGVTDNTQALRDMITAVPTGALIYFPRGVYGISDTITITKALSFIGDSIIQHNNQSIAMAYESAIVYIGNNNDISLFTRNQPYSVAFKGLSFYGNSFSVVANTDVFEQLPYPFYKEVTTHSNINGLDLAYTQDAGMSVIENCHFCGFSGVALSQCRHRIVRDCSFHDCNIAISIMFDGLVQNCWINRTHTAIKCEKVNNEPNQWHSINVSDCWVDQISGHFMEGADITEEVLLIDNVWVDMVDSSAFYFPNALINKSHVQGQFGRIGMKYAGLADSARTEVIAADSDFIYANLFRGSTFDISVGETIIGSGNNPSGKCTSKYFYPVSWSMNDCVLNVPQLTIADLMGKGAAYNTDITCKDGHITYHVNTQYLDGVAYGGGTPIGSKRAPSAGYYYYDTTNNTTYRSTGSTVNDWEEIPYVTLTELETRLDGIKYYDVMPSDAELLAMPNNTTFFIKGFYNKTDGNGGYYLITTNWSAASLRIKEDDVVKRYLVPLNICNDKGDTQGEINICRYGIRKCVTEVANLTEENSYAELNSTIWSNIYNLPYGCTIVFPKGKYYFKNPINLSNPQYSLKGSGSNAQDTMFLASYLPQATILCFPYLTNGQTAITGGNGCISDIVIYGDILNYNITFDRTKTITAPNEVVTETIKEVDGVQYQCTGLNGFSVVNNVAVGGFYTGVIPRGSGYITNLYLFKCHLGIDYTNDTQTIGLYGWNLHTVVELSSALNQITQLRVDNCVNCIKTWYGGLHKILNVDADYCTDSLILVDGSLEDSIITCTGRCNTLKSYDKDNDIPPTGDSIVSSPNGYGIIFVKSGATLQNNQIQILKAGYQNPFDSSSVYRTPSIIIAHETNAKISDNSISCAMPPIFTNPIDLFETSNATLFNIKYDNLINIYHISQDGAVMFPNLEFTSQELQAMW